VGVCFVHSHMIVCYLMSCDLGFHFPSVTYLNPAVTPWSLDDCNITEFCHMIGREQFCNDIDLFLASCSSYCGTFSAAPCMSAVVPVCDQHAVFWFTAK